MKHKLFLFPLLVFILFACTPSTSVVSTISPTGTPTRLTAPTKIYSPTTTSTPIIGGYTYFSMLQAKVDFEGLKCESFFWEEVGLNIEVGSVQPFAIRGLHAHPDAEVLCSGYFVVPPEPGNGYFVYKDWDKGIQVVAVTYSQNDIDQNVFQSSKNTTPTPSK